MSESHQFNPQCICGGSVDLPNADCERCRMQGELAALRSQLAAEKQLKEAAEALAAGLEDAIKALHEKTAKARDYYIDQIKFFPDAEKIGCTPSVRAGILRDMAEGIAALLAPAAERRPAVESKAIVAKRIEVPPALAEAQRIVIKGAIERRGGLTSGDAAQLWE